MVKTEEIVFSPVNLDYCELNNKYVIVNLNWREIVFLLDT